MAKRQPPKPLPGARICRGRFMRKVRSKTKEKLEDFLQLSCLEPADKGKLLKDVRRLEVELAGLDVWNLSVIIWSRVFLLLVAYVVIAGGPWLLGQSLPLFREQFLSRWSAEPLYLIAIFVIGWLFLIFPVLPLSFSSRKAIEYFRSAVFVSVWVMIGGLACAGVAYRIITLPRSGPPGAFEATIAVALVSMCSFIMITAVGSFAIGLIDRGLKLRQHRFAPNAIVADLFLQVLSTTEKRQHEWHDVNFKRDIIRKLAEIAACVEADYPMSLKTGDAGTDVWQKQTAEQISAGVRNLIMWVYMPKSDTREQFINRVASYFICAVNGDWDGFERAEPQVVSRPELLRSRLRSAVTAVASAIIPLIMLVVVKNLNLIGEPVLSYLTVGAFIWTGLSLLSHVDPAYGSKLTAIKEISSFLPLPKRGRE